eukprot:Sdes_comp20112_c0_seq1m13134
MYFSGRNFFPPMIFFAFLATTLSWICQLAQNWSKLLKYSSEFPKGKISAACLGPVFYSLGFLGFYIVIPQLHWRLHKLQPHSKFLPHSFYRQNFYGYICEFNLPSWKFCSISILSSFFVHVFSCLLFQFNWKQFSISIFLGAFTAVQTLATLWITKNFHTFEYSFLLIGVLSGIFGILFNTFLVSHQYFSYSNPDFYLMIPHWIFWLWWSASLGFGLMVLKFYQFDYRQERKKLKGKSK